MKIKQGRQEKKSLVDDWTDCHEDLKIELKRIL